MTEIPARNNRRNIIISFLSGIVFAFIAIAMMEYAGFFCDGPCAVRQCTPASPCVINGVTYTSGQICGAGEGLLCDSGILYDCHCKTFIKKIRGGGKEPDCICQ